MDAVETAGRADWPRSVTLFSPGWPKSAFPNGIVAYVDLMRTALSDLGVPATVLARITRGEAQEQGVVGLQHRLESRTVLSRARHAMVRKLGRDTWQTAHLASAVIDEVKRLQSRDAVDVLEIEESFGWCGRVCQASIAPTVVRIHGPWFLNGVANGQPADAAYRSRVRREGLGLQRSSAVTAPSRDVLDRTRAFYDLPLADAEVIPNPVTPVAEQDHWSLDRCEQGTILFVGRFDRHKGGDLAIDAFTRIAERRRDVRMLFAGPDRGLRQPDGSRVSLTEYVAQRLPQAATRERMQVLGQQSPSDIAALRQRCMVTIMPSRYEVVGYTALEAMAAGCPLVAARTGGVPELVDHEENGLLCEPDSAEALAEQVERLLDDPDQAARLGRAAVESVASEHDPRVVASRTLAYYRRVCGVRSGSESA